MAHSKLVIEVGTHNGEILVEVNGCNACLTRALTKILLTNNSFKEILNTAIRAANAERAKKEN